MGQWKEALTDLEFAVRRDPDNRDLHKILSEVYEKLHDPDMAAAHQRLAQVPLADKKPDPGSRRK